MYKSVVILMVITLTFLVSGCAVDKGQTLIKISPTVKRISLTEKEPMKSVPNQSPPNKLQSYPIGPGDILQVTIFAGGDKQEDFIAGVSAKGTMVSPLIGEVELGGLTASEAAGKITGILARDFFINPQVLVTLKESGKKVYISGEVRKPGAYSIQEGLTAMNACILAGGFTEYASAGRVEVTRMENGKQKIIQINLDKVQAGKAEDLALQAGDRIRVPQRLF